MALARKFEATESSMKEKRTIVTCHDLINDCCTAQPGNCRAQILCGKKKTANILWYLLPTSIQSWRQNLPWGSLLSDRNIFSSYFSYSDLFAGTSWFKMNYGSSLPHKCRLHYTSSYTIYSNVASTYIYQVFVFMLTLMNIRRGWHGRFLFQDLGLELVTKTCPHRPQALEKPKKRFRRICFFSSFVFWTRRLQVLQGMTYVCKTFHANVRRSDLPMLNIK